MTLIEQTITINGGRVEISMSTSGLTEAPLADGRSIRDLVEAGVQGADRDKERDHDLAGLGNLPAESALSTIQPGSSDIERTLEVVSDLAQDVSSSVASETVPAVARVEPTVGEPAHDSGLVTRPVVSSAPAAISTAGAPTPYFSDGTVTLYHGDCLELLDVWRHAAVMITDPPYGLEGVAGAYGMSHRTIANDQDTTVRDAVLEIWGDRPAAVFGSPRLEEPPGGWSDRLVWDKGQLGLNGGAWRYAHESIFVRGTGWVRLNDASSSILRYTSQANRRNVAKHIHSKPVPLIAQLVASAPPGLIVDPFGGGGSTAVACATLGRPVVIIELEREHCDTIVSRLQQQTFDFGVIS